MYAWEKRVYAIHAVNRGSQKFAEAFSLGNNIADIEAARREGLKERQLALEVSETFAHFTVTPNFERQYREGRSVRCLCIQLKEWMPHFDGGRGGWIVLGGTDMLVETDAPTCTPPDGRWVERFASTAYRSLHRLPLKEMGAKKQGQRLKAWLDEHPDAELSDACLSIAEVLLDEGYDARLLLWAGLQLVLPENVRQLITAVE